MRDGEPRSSAATLRPLNFAPCSPLGRGRRCAAAEHRASPLTGTAWPTDGHMLAATDGGSMVHIAALPTCTQACAAPPACMRRGPRWVHVHRALLPRSHAHLPMRGAGVRRLQARRLLPGDLQVPPRRKARLRGGYRNRACLTLTLTLILTCCSIITLMCCSSSST